MDGDCKERLKIFFFFSSASHSMMEIDLICVVIRDGDGVGVRSELEWRRLTFWGRTWARRSFNGSLNRRLFSLKITLTVTRCSGPGCDGRAGVAMMQATGERRMGEQGRSMEKRDGGS